MNASRGQVSWVCRGKIDMLRPISHGLSHQTQQISSRDLAHFVLKGKQINKQKNQFQKPQF